MYPTNTALLKKTNDDLRPDQQTATVPSLQDIQSEWSTGQTHVSSPRNADRGYHFVMVDTLKDCPAYIIVNGYGVPDDTLSSFAGHLVSTIGRKQAHAQLAPVLSYLTWLAQRGILWYDPDSCLQAAWQDHCRQSTSARNMSGGVVMVLATIARHDRALHTLHSMLEQFYTFAIACQTYGYQHPFGGQRQRLLRLSALLQFAQKF